MTWTNLRKSRRSRHHVITREPPVNRRRPPPPLNLRRRFFSPPLIYSSAPALSAYLSRLSSSPPSATFPIHLRRRSLASPPTLFTIIPSFSTASFSNFLRRRSPSPPIPAISAAPNPPLPFPHPAPINRGAQATYAMVSSVVVAELLPPLGASSNSNKESCASKEKEEEEEEGGLPEEAREVVKALAKRMWAVGEEEEGVEECKVRRLKGAMTNEVYECSWGRNKEDVEEEERPRHDGGRRRKVVLVRVYGEGVDIFFDRADEIRTFEAMSRAGHGPRLLARFPNGRVEEFLHARTLTAADIRDPAISTKVAARLRDFHRLSLPGPREPRIWRRLRDWLQKAIALCGHEQAEEFGLEGIDKEIEELRLRLEEMPHSEVGFCHNDLQYGNIMMDEDDESITIIDYEYASYNPVAYDIANHFCEMAADYHTDTPHLLDYSKYPDLEERIRFITAYLQSSHDYNASSLRVEELAKEAEMYTLASHIHWGLWGIISASVNDIDFDYMDYARQRFSQYFVTKTMLFGIP